MQVGKLVFRPALEHPDELAESVAAALKAMEPAAEAGVCGIDPELADTAAFCEHYQIGLEVSANCVIVEAKRADRVWYAACLILATTKADVNGSIRRLLDARKISFAPMDTAVARSGMQYGGITPIGLPADWPIIIDEAVMQQPSVVVGSGIRGSKVYIATGDLARLPNSQVADIVKRG